MILKMLEKDFDKCWWNMFSLKSKWNVSKRKKTKKGGQSCKYIIIECDVHMVGFFPKIYETMAHCWFRFGWKMFYTHQPVTPLHGYCSLPAVSILSLFWFLKPQAFVISHIPNNNIATWILCSQFNCQLPANPQVPFLFFGGRPKEKRVVLRYIRMYVNLFPLFNSFPFNLYKKRVGDYVMYDTYTLAFSSRHKDKKTEKKKKKNLEPL